MNKHFLNLLALGIALTVSVSLAAQAGPDVVIPAVSSYTLTPGSITLGEVSRENPALTFRIGDLVVVFGPDPRGGFILRAENEVLAALVAK
jgi:hypothetical protein